MLKGNKVRDVDFSENGYGRALNASNGLHVNAMHHLRMG